MTVLVLGGTAEARALAEHLHREAINFVSSLAGRVAQPRLPVGMVRIGGFGGVDGLVSFLVEQEVSAVIDATHPFAEGMSANAVAACRAVGVPLLRLERPGWAGAPGADRWRWVDHHLAAAALVAGLSTRPFLTVGRQQLGVFTGHLSAHAVLARVVDAPEIALPDAWTLLTSRGPYDLVSERKLMTGHPIDALVTKDSGGSYTWPKMQVAMEMGIPVVVVRRRRPVADVETVSDPAGAADWVKARS